MSAGAPNMTGTSWLDTVIAGDRRRSRALGAWLCSAAIVILCGLIAAVLFDAQLHGDAVVPLVILAAGNLVAAVVAPVAVVAVHRARARRWKQRQRELDDLDGILNKISDTTLRPLISFNFRLMDRFVAVALSEARASFVACCVAASASLAVLLVGATFVLAIDDAGGQAAAAALAAVGAALSSYLSVTFLGTFRATAKQMSYYYGQPLVHCYLLHAEWLAERFEGDADPAVRLEIHRRLINATLRAADRAQDHLLDLQLAASGRRPARRPGTDRGADGAFLSAWPGVPV
jgi:hypothetical protein